jgi:hypothetical protein
MVSDDLSILIRKVTTLDAEIEDLESSLKARKEERDSVLEEDIPCILHENGLASAPLSDGRTVVIDSIVNVSQGDKELLQNWLQVNGYDSVIKTNFQFPKGSDVSAFEAQLREDGVDFSKEINIHPMTLKKVMADHIKEGGEYPPEAAAKVSIFERAKIKEAK